MGVDKVLTGNVNVAISEFFSLQGDTFTEKKKSFQAFLTNLSLSPQELDVFGDHLLTNKPCVLGIDIFLWFNMDRHILEVIKSNNGPLVGRILKNWTFFKNIFASVTPEELVNTVLPLLSFTIRMKVINRICKTLTDEMVADCLFELLEDKFGILSASVVIPICSVALIKSVIVKYDLKLSERQLWSIYKKDSTFVEYYFSYHVDILKAENSVVHIYKQLMNKIVNTNSTLFWNLVEKYKIPFSIGKHTCKKVLINRDVLLKYVIEKPNNCTVTFPERQIYKASVKLGLQEEYLLTFYPDNSDDFLNDQLRTVPSLQKYVPKTQRFTLTNTLFREKYSDDLVNYPHVFKDVERLELLTTPERELILDKLEYKEELLYFYSADKSVPIIKEKLQSASDLNVRTKLISMWFKTCNVNNSKENLLDLLNVLYNRYRNDTSILSNILNHELIYWKKFGVLESQHWEAINKLINYANQCNISVYEKNTYILEYLKYLVENNKSTNEFLDTIIKEALEATYSPNLSYRVDGIYGKIFYEGTEKILRLHKEDGNYKSACVSFLQGVIEFDKHNPNLVNLKDYLYILDFCDDENAHYNEIFVYLLNRYGIFHSNMQKYYQNTHSSCSNFYEYCIKKSPRNLFKINDVYSKISSVDRNIFEFLNCPYLKNSYSTFKENALTQLNSDETYLDRNFSMKFLCLLDEAELLNFTTRFDPPEDGKIPLDLDTLHLEIQKYILKCLPLVSFPRNMAILVKYCKGDYLKFALPSLYKILFRCPHNQVEDFLRNMYKSAVSVRKHSLCLGRHLLSPNSFGQFLEMVNNQENNLSVRFVFLKKAREYFIEMHDVKFYNFVLENLNKIDDKDLIIFDYITRYSKIPNSYLMDYIQQICQKISQNSDKQIKSMKLTVLNSLPNHVFENLDDGFITGCFEEDFFEIMSFAIKCLFYSKSDIHQLIFNRFNTFLSGDIRSKKNRVNIDGFVQQFCEKALEEKAVDKFMIFYSNCQNVFPEYSLINDRFLIDFTEKWFESHCDIKQFALKINKYLIDSVKLYTHNIISDFCEVLKEFMVKAKIEEFEFVENFFYTNSLDETYIGTIYLLPDRIPTDKNTYHKYVPLVEALKKVKTHVVIAYLDLYYNRAY